MAAADDSTTAALPTSDPSPLSGGVSGARPVVAQSPESGATGALEEEQVLRAEEYALDVLHSRYELYAWCEAKVNNLVTVSGVLLGAVFLIITNDKIRHGWTAFDYTLASLGSVMLATGLILSLVHIIPKMDSGLGNETNPRVTIAIDNFSKDEYYEKILGLTPEASLRTITDQIKGMSRNVMRSQRAIRRASHATIVGLLVLGALVARSVL